MVNCGCEGSGGGGPGNEGGAGGSELLRICAGGCHCCPFEFSGGGGKDPGILPYGLELGAGLWLCWKDPGIDPNKLALEGGPWDC